MQLEWTLLGPLDPMENLTQTYPIITGLVHVCQAYGQLLLLDVHALGLSMPIPRKSQPV